MAWCITVTLVAVLILQTSAQPYTHTGTAHPDCSTNVRIQPSNPIQVTRGDQGAPCVGYVQYDLGGGGAADYRRMCSNGGLGNSLFTKANAQRICYTLGLNMWRETGFNDNNDDQIMLYDCDTYTEADVDIPDGAGAGNVAGLPDSPFNFQSEKQCHPALSSPDTFCYDECHIGGAGDPQEVMSDTEANCNADEPFYAITCSDRDECNNGVLYDCLGPFPENCKIRDACGPYTNCQNQIGSWTCSCKPGFEPALGNAQDPYSVSIGCTDINECLIPDICGYHAQCRNKRGSYLCICLYPALWNPVTRKCRQITCNTVPTIPYAYATSSVPASPVYGDKVTFACNKGYKVEYHVIPNYGLTSPYQYTPYYYDTYYWYNNVHRSDTTFELKCTASGHWGPNPLPSCVRRYCKDPGYVEYATWSGDDWDYEKKVTYTCKPGYKPYGDEYHGKNYFTKTCKEDGTWTKGTYCEDIDECAYGDTHSCRGKAKYCHNTPGSYRCSCVSYEDYKSYDTYECPETHYPDPCEELERLGFCVHGKCEEKNGKAYCECYDGYHGSTCEKPWGNTALIIAIIALVLVIIALIILIVFCCCFNNIGGPDLVGPPPVVAPIEPIYGRRKPVLRRNFWHRHF